MRYLVLLLSLIVVMWGAWVFLADRPGLYKATGLKACNSINSNNPNQFDGLRCENNINKSADSLEKQAIVGIIGGSVLGVIAFNRIIVKSKQHAQMASEREDEE